jgi:copper transport protein
VACLGVAAAILGAPASASAHAYVITTSPAVGAAVHSPPARVSLTYDEAVTITTGALAVYTSAGRRVDSGVVAHPAADTIVVTIPRRLARGTYTVAWRVTSADTHVVHGEFSFSVGVRGNAGAIAAELRARGAVPEGIALGFGIVRFFNLLLLLACGGGAAVLVLVLRDADPRIRRLLLRTLVACGGLLALVAVLGIPFEAAEANGSGLGGGFAASALAATRHVRFGEVWLMRAWLAVLLALLALSLQMAGERWRAALELTLLTVSAGLLLTLSAAGHASVRGPGVFVVDAAHVFAAAAWLGGLAFVVGAIVVSEPAARWPLAIRSVPRFSLLASASVGVLVVAGVINADLEVGAWSGLWRSTYGELVLAKAALALPLLGLGAFNNRVSVPALHPGTLTQAVRTRLLRAAGAELVLLIAVVGVTAALIGEAPYEPTLARATSITARQAAGPFTDTVTVAPDTVGANTINISVVDTSTKPHPIGEVDLAADPPPSSHLRPLNLNVSQLSPVRFRVSGAEFPLAGAWHIELTVRTGVTEWLARISLSIRSAPRP